MAPMYVLDISKRWPPGSTVVIAFSGGAETLHRQIAQVAALWSLYGNIGLDFGYIPGAGYRTWNPTGVQSTAHIRVAFDQPGYWSCVGTDSVNPVCAEPRESSLNLGGFDRALPANWQSVVLHEVGHALGFQHEHQNPTGGCDAEFRWDDDPDYVRTTDGLGQFIKDSQNRRPGIYTVLGGPPNRWRREKVDFNLRQLPNSSAYDASAIDNLSIMKYEFPEWMYIHGTSSPCFSRRNDDLSPLDRQGVARLYPREPTDIAATARQREQALIGLRDAIGLPAAIKHDVQGLIQGMRAIK